MDGAVRPRRARGGLAFSISAIRTPSRAIARVRRGSHWVLSRSPSASSVIATAPPTHRHVLPSLDVMPPMGAFARAL